MAAFTERSICALARSTTFAMPSKNSGSEKFPLSGSLFGASVFGFADHGLANFVLRVRILTVHYDVLLIVPEPQAANIRLPL
jgi:hypothetical protein